MPTPLPASSEFTGSTVTEGGFKTAITNLRAYLAGLTGTDGTSKAARQTLGTAYNGTLTKSAAYTVVAADVGKVVNCSGTWALSLDDAAVLGDGFMCALYVSSGTITVDPYLSQTINGATTLTANAGDTLVLYCDGSNWVALGIKGTAGAYSAMIVYTATSTWSKSAGLVRVKTTVVGRGGNGGTGYGGSSPGGGGGGGGGGCAIKTIEAAALAATETVTVATTSGSSSFGSHCSATSGGNGGNALSGISGTGGVGGVGAGGDVNFTGDVGGYGDGYAAAPPGGNGGSSFLGGGGLGGKSAPGTVGSNYGGGGGGGGGGYTNNGGVGAQGIVIVEEFYQ